MKFICCITIFLLAGLSRLCSQLCTGSLGDPVVNITFGFGSNPGRPLPGGLTAYSYSGSTCPKQDEYCLSNLSFGCFDNSWHTVIGDHTPNDAGGYCMLINGGSGKKNFVVYTVKDLCPNTTYEFAAWVKNVLRPSACDRNGADPNLTFLIETLSGTVLATYNSGDLQEEEEPTWKQFGMLFTTRPGETDLVLKIMNSATSNCGNILALDDITVRACGGQVNTKINSNGLTTEEVCESNKTSFVLSANFGLSYTNPAVQWQILADGSIWKDIPGANSPTFIRTVTGSGEYVYRMLIAEAGRFSSPQCRVASNEVSINVLQAPFVQATNYIYGCLGGDVTLLASGANSYLWTGPDGYRSSEQSPVLKDVKYADSGLYRVTGTTNIGCTNTDSTILKVYPNATARSLANATICEGTSIRLEAGGGTYYQWEPAITLSDAYSATPLASPVENTIYKVKVTNQFGCSDTVAVAIAVWKKPIADAGPDLKTRVGIPIVLKGAAKGSDVSWYWSPSASLSSTRELSPVINPAQTTAYRLNVVSPHGCGTSTDEVMVKVYDKVIIPNAFSPNGDGINDTWIIEPLNLFEESVTEVYNRFGQVVYRSKGYNSPWNGTSNGNPVPVGTYYYIIDLKVKNEQKLSGAITILR